MANNYGTDLNLFKSRIHEECSTANITFIGNVDIETIKTQTEVVGGSWIPPNADSNELLQNENRNVENSAEQLLNGYLVCQSCQMQYNDYCMNCGHLIHILNNETEVGVSGRAKHSVPKSILEIKGSLVDGYGVYALRNIPKGVKFGPYEGLEALHRRNNYFWKIRYGKLIETKDGNNCNWMRFIDCTSTQSAQNLIILQFMGKIYYKTLREIKTGEELLMKYSNSGCDNLGMQSIQYFRPDVEEVTENIFKCEPCYYGFSEEKYLVNHTKVCPYKKQIVIDANISRGIKAFEDDSKICERINKLSTYCPKDQTVNLDGEGEVLEQDVIDNIKTNNKEEKEKLKLPHSNNGCLTTDVKMQVPQKKYCDNNVILKHVNGMMEEALKYDPINRERVNNLSINRQNDNEDRLDFDNENMDFNEDKNMFQQDRNESMNVNNKEEKEKLKFLHDDNDCLSIGTLKNRVLVSQKKCKKNNYNNYNPTEKKYKCNDCSYAAVRKQLLQYHISCHHTLEKPFKCNECSYAALQRTNLLCHIRSKHTLEKPFKCSVCSYAAVKKSTLVSHIRARHSMEKPHKCNACSYAAVKKCNLLAHIKSCHTMEKPYKCHECSFAAVRKQELLRHIRCHHAAVNKSNLGAHTTEKPYKCNECSYAAARKQQLVYHIRSWHTLEKPFKCSICSYAAVKKYRLLSHIKSRHTMDKPLKCNECSYATARKQHLVYHIRSRHTLEKPFKCSICSYAAVNKYHLLSHIKSRHTIEKPYKCNECSYVAVKKSTLVSHIRARHSTEKPHKCNACSYAAVKKWDLLAHIKSCHTMEKPYTCHECSFTAVRKQKLLCHIRSRHTAVNKSNLVAHTTEKNL